MSSGLSARLSTLMEVVAAKWLQSTDLQTYTLVSSHTPLQRPARTNQLTLKFKVTKKPLCSDESTKSEPLDHLTDEFVL